MDPQHIPGRSVAKRVAVLVLASLVGSLLPPLSVSAIPFRDDSLVGYWKFDETSGTSAADSSGDGITGTYQDSPTISTDVPSPIAFSNPRSLSFDGSNDCVYTSEPSLSSTNLTVSAWVKLSATQKSRIFFAKWGSGNAQGMGLGIDDETDNLAKWYTATNATNHTLESTTVLSNDTWYHIVGTFDGTTKRMYVNGVQESSATWANAIEYSNTVSGLGCLRGATIQYLNGKLDDVRIYNRALSGREIAELYAGNHPTSYWTGTNNTSLNHASNWSGSYLPGPYDKVVIQASTRNAIMTGALFTAGLTINTGALLNLSGTGLTINDSGTFTNYGTLALKNSETLTGFTNDATKGTVMITATGATTGLKTGNDYHSLNINDGLVGYWKLDETSGTRAADTSGYGNSGSLVNGPTISTTVAPTSFTNARSVSFDGSNDHVLVQNNPTLNPGRAVTVAAWAKTNTTDFQAIVVQPAGSSWADPYARYDVRFRANGGDCQNSISPAVGALIVEFWTQTFTGRAVCSDQTLATGVWYHIAATYDGSSEKIYINGVLKGSLSVSGNITASTQNLSIGARLPDGPAEVLNGGLDDVRIYNRALSKEEIAALAAGNHPATSSGNLLLNGNVGVAGNLLLNSGKLDASSSNYTVTVSGSWLNNGGAFNPRAGTVKFNGGSSGKNIQSGGQRFNGLSILAGGAWTLLDRLNLSGSLTISAGTLDVSSNNYTVTAGTLNQTAGTFTPQSGIVVLQGQNQANQTVRAASSLNTLRIEDPTEDGLVGYWKFDEGQGRTVRDYSGNSNNGTTMNGPTWSGGTLNVPSNIQFDDPFAMKFDGSDDYVQMANGGSVDFNGQSAFSVSAWVHPKAAANSNANIVSKPFQWYVNFHTDQKIRFGFYTSSSTFVSNYSTSTVAINTWTHLLLTYDGSARRIYINGELDSTTSQTGNLAYGDGTNCAVRIGAEASACSSPETRYFNGLIDDIRVYDRALSGNEAANLYRGRYANGGNGTATFSVGATDLTTSTLAIDSGAFSNGSSNTASVSNALTLSRGNGILATGAGGTFTLSNGLTLSGATVSGAAGTLDINGNLSILTGSLIAPSGTMTISGDFSRTGGSFTHNSGIVTFDAGTSAKLRSGGQAFNNVTVDGSTKSLTLSGALTVAGTLTIGSDDILHLSGSNLTAGTLANNNVLFARGGESISITTNDDTSGTFRFVGDQDGAADSYVLPDLGSGTDYYNLTIAPIDSAETFYTHERKQLSGALVISRGTLNLSGSTVNVEGLTTLSGGTLLAGSGARTLHAGLTVSGGTYRGGTSTLDLNNTLTITAGTFIAPSRTFTLSGSLLKYSGAFLASGSTLTLDSTLPQTLSGTLTFYNLTRTVSSGTTLSFHPGHTYTVSGALILRGAASHLLAIRSATSGIAAGLKLVTGGSQTLDYLDVKDSDASAGLELLCYTDSEGCVNSGNNTNWTFSSSSSSSSSSSEATTTAASGGGGGGGGRGIRATEGGARAGSTEFQRIAEARAFILARFQGKRDEAQRIVKEHDETEKKTKLALDLKKTIDTAALHREKKLQERIAEEERKLKLLRDQRERISQEYAQRREDRLARQLQLQEELIAKQEAEKKQAELDLLSAQEENRKRQKERIAESIRKTARQSTALLPPDVIAERRGRLYAVVDQRPVIFADVPLSAWYAPYVSFLVEEGVAHGYKDAQGRPTGEFGVENSITYAEVLKMAIEAAGKEVAGGSPRNDSAKNTWAAAYVKQAEDLSLTVYAASLSVHTPATRGAVIQTILEVMGFPIAKQGSTYTDVPASHPFMYAIATATFFGLVSGDADDTGAPLNRFRPDAPMNRAEVAKIIAIAKEVAKTQK